MKLKKVTDDAAAMKLVKQGWIPMLQVGKIKDSSGKEHDFTHDRFKKIVENYDPEFRKAPIVVGHPKSNGPAFGWVSKLSVAGDFLLGLPEKVQEKFRKWVNTGALNTRSVSLEGDHLRHLGFLGAALPACPGLGDVELSWDGITALFGEGEPVSFEASKEDVADFAVVADPQDPDWELAWKIADIGEVLRRLRDEMIADRGIEYANERLPHHLIGRLSERPVPKPKVSPSPSHYTQGEDVMTPEQIAAMQAENANLKAANQQLTTDLTAAQGRVTDLETSFTAAADAAWTKTRDEFLAGLQKDGKLLPAEVEQTKGMLDRARTAGQGEFSEEKNAELKQVMDFLRKQPAKIRKAPVATNTSASAAPSTGDEATELAAAATEFMADREKAGKPVTLDVAMEHVQKQRAAS